MRAAVSVVVLLLAVAGAWLLVDHFFPKHEPQSKPSVLPKVAAIMPVDPEPEVLEVKLEEEAETFIETLTETNPEPVAAESADHFVRADQSISLLSTESILETSRAEILADPELTPDTPITVVKEIEQVEVITPEKLIAESGGDLGRPITVLEGNAVKETTVREVLAAHAKNPDKPISIVKKVRYYEITTPGELQLQLDLDQTVQGEALVGVIKSPYHLEAATIADLLVEEKLLDPTAVFYVRTVRNTDSQGIWGIVQAGLVENFARGIAIRRGEELNTYQVDIPALADEVLANQSSSYLGRLIYVKSRDSYVYNYKHNKMGRNPDALLPGQQIVIVKFTPAELINIYKHFVRN